MDKRRLIYIIEWVIAVAACVWLVWKLATYEDYATLWAALKGMQIPQICALLLCVALMPVNMALEAWRWYTLMNEGVNELKSEGISFKEAQRQVYYSKLAGLITPWRLGEYPARGLLMSRQPSAVSNQESLWPRVLSMGAVGSATMTIAIVIAGAVGIACSPSVFEWLGGSYLYSLLAVVIVLGAVYAFAPRVLKRFAQVNHDLMLRSIGQSLVRLACWCVQLMLVLWALGAISFQPSAISLLPVYYILVTITPNVPIVEAGVRGAWAIVVFGTVNAALAGVLLWAINTLLPCVVWFFLRKKQ